jgi:4,5-DOPA dioxygenase extradiol
MESFTGSKSDMMKRKDFLKIMATTPLILSGMKLTAFENISDGFSRSAKMPILFIGHGHPMNALYDNSFTQALGKIGQTIEKPNAIMVVSAHWETRGTFVSVNPQPKAIYDFGGFDDRLFQVKYEPKGHPALAQETALLGADYGIQKDQSMGLDHGAWTVLRHMFPKADIPVFQMSIDFTKPEAYHFELANTLKKMRERGVLVLASGNIVHNLGIMDWNNINANTFDWAAEFDELVKDKLEKQDFNALINHRQFGRLSQLAVPSTDHYFPMLYSLGLADKNESVKFLYEGHQYGSISMRCFQIS